VSNVAHHPLYRNWQSMRQRCKNPNHPSYADYGGRGINVCPEWDNSFTQFLADMGERPDGLTLDRINNDGHYEPGNCRWATWDEQANNRRNNVVVTIHGKTKPLRAWCELMGVPYKTAARRIRAGYDIKSVFCMA
jgi:hypothetical protein